MPREGMQKPKASSVIEEDAELVLALADTPINAGTVVARIAMHRKWTGRSGRVRVSDVSPVLATLEKRGDAIESGSLHRLHEPHVWRVLQEAKGRGHLARIAKELLGRGRSGYISPYATSIAQLRLLMMLGPKDALARKWDSALRHQYGLEGDFIARVFAGSLRPEWRAMLEPYAYHRFLTTACEKALDFLLPMAPLALEDALQSSDPKMRAAAARVFAMRGEEVELDGLALNAQQRGEVRLWGALLRRDYAAALELGDEVAMTRTGKPRALASGARTALALARAIGAARDGAVLERLSDHFIREPGQQSGNRGLLRMIVLSLINAIREQRPVATRHEHFWYDYERPLWHELLTERLGRLWTGGAVREKAGATLLEEYHRLAVEGGYSLVQSHLADTLTALRGGEPAADSLVRAYRQRPAWEIALDTLETIAAEDSANAAASAAKQGGPRLAWMVELRGDGDDVRVTPHLFSSPRARAPKNVSLERLLKGKVECTTDHDRRVLATVQEEKTYGYGSRTYYYLGPKALPALIGHASVIDGAARPVQVVAGEGELRAERVARKATRLSIHPPNLAHHAVTAAFRGENELVVYERSAELARVAALLASGPIEIPNQAEGRLASVLGKMGSKVRVGAGEQVAIEGKPVASNPRPALLCRWQRERLSLRLRTTPFGLQGPHFVSGHGASQIVAVVDGEALRTERNLEAERSAREALLQREPLASLPWSNDTSELEGLEDALDLLAALGDDRAPEEALDCTVAWPDGNALPTPTRLGVSTMRASIREGKDWLVATIELEVDPSRVLSYRELLARRTEGGRYYRLDDGGFLALSQELGRRLESLESLGKVSPKGIETSPVLLPRLMELTDDAGARKLDRKSKTRLAALESALSAEVATPRTIEAELRDYQHEGFVWMARLADAGLGACLADDMGLGKTIQTLALLARRASLGPALVVAPTSVVGTWIAEARRFAPSLELLPFSDAVDRVETLAKAAPNQVFVTSYGVLITEAEALAATRFETVVFDEAHALKNSQTLRSKAAFALNAGFRLSLTGTPVENHLGELWSVMRATLPGLLGSEKAFQKEFVQPIANGSRSRLAELRSRLAPFLLRRTKAAVLDELPERMETTLLVDPTPDERAFYAALRERALQRCSDSAIAGGDARMQILAEITRLRQAAVDPRVLDEEAPAGAKLEVLVERVLALHEEGHRPLIFTQFLPSLSRIQRSLEREGLVVLTLDGSLSAKERGARVEQFQQGNADAFVMSLHAGGVGITLTAADYIFHVDPWWNPAVEEQATGRAHRIGQKRPVHVYRLVTAGSIEEKILELHSTKRKLTGDLLEGLGEAQKLDIDTLRGLLG